jgi:protein-S-isoprenylcysteine O-methyltransferase Ste14
MIIGLYYLIWSTVTQWKKGEGTPAPNAPTQHLIITGPYKYSRNPIEFGAIMYYLGFGTFVGGIIVGIICFILGFTVGSIYHKFIEEKELEKRFGEEYIKYKENTPFVFPKLKK